MTAFVLVSVALVVLLAAGIAIGAEIAVGQLTAERPWIADDRNGESNE